MDAIAFWNYASTNGNNVTEFSLRFATEADGPGNIGTTIGYNPEFILTNCSVSLEHITM